MVTGVGQSCAGGGKVGLLSFILTHSHGHSSLICLKLCRNASLGHLFEVALPLWLSLLLQFRCSVCSVSPWDVNTRIMLFSLLPDPLHGLSHRDAFQVG